MAQPYVKGIQRGAATGTLAGAAARLRMAARYRRLFFIFRPPSRQPPPRVCHFVRFQTISTGDPPPEGAGFVHFSSSPLTVRLLSFWSVPVQFGYELPSICRFRSVPLTV